MSRKVSGSIVYYMCKTYRDLSKKACTIHSIRQDRLEEAVLYAIQQQIYLAVDYTKLVDDINRAPGSKDADQEAAGRNRAKGKGACEDIPL